MTPEYELLSKSVGALWRAVEQLQADLERERGQRESLERRLGALEREALGREQLRVPLAKAVRMLGASRQHLLRLGQAGELDLVDVRDPGAPRATWTVGLESIERLLEERRGDRPGRPGHADRPAAGRDRRAPQ